ncbi:C25 family cysteine peptidase [Candidatus Methanocrinis natronophilus]|uniref:C25 family cysteine peptidase n=1 Tax=Candidatus Methanocrinis natronophilus TaxID=3033396 RepID=A0ABT5X4Y7_9EURY|nr:C25 family cysteine peptidase [Candidatus Methanocrinis natronophilus]MDF0589751.1 C25 family cysteine peptidase [Candidatus Methanocrinis natronophilus]
MKKIMALWLVCLLYLSFGLAFASSASVDPGSTGMITLQYQLDDPNVEMGRETLSGPDGSEMVYDRVTIPGLNDRIVSGEPVIPFKTARILIPYGEEVREIKVVAGNEKYLGRVSIMPGQNSVPIGFTSNCTECRPQDNWTSPDHAFLDESIYGSDRPYPEVAYSVLGVQKKHGYSILSINLYPIKYIPKTGDAYSFAAFDVEVTTSPAETLSPGLLRGLPRDKREVEMIVDNPEKTTTYPSDLAATGRSLLLDGYYDYIVITNQYLKEAPGPYNFQALIEKKKEKGLNAAIVTVEDIYANYRQSVRQDDQEVIRDFIRDAYTNNQITYVLLGGDGDGARIGGETWDAIVPTRLLWAWAYEPCPESCGIPRERVGIASDLYYASLEGDFKGANGVYGGPGVNLYANVYVGRAPVDNYIELSNFVRKTIAYDSTPSTDRYLRGIWMVGEYMEPMGVLTLDDEPLTWKWGGDYKDRIKPIFPANFSVQTLYDRDFPGDECCPNQHNWGREHLIREINANYVHAINHVGTSNFCDVVAYVMKMGYQHADALTNEKYFLGYSQAGYAGAFDNRDPNGIYLPHDSVLEHFVTAKGGAFAFIGNSRYGLINPSSIENSPSQKFDLAFWEEMFNATDEYGRPVTNIGYINQISKEKFIGAVDGGEENMRYSYYSINLLGCPETPFIIPSGVLTPKVEDTAPAVPEILTEAVVEVEKKKDTDLAVPDIFSDGMRFELDFHELDFPTLDPGVWGFS